MSSTSRPNILFAIADDASHYLAYGHSFVRTPAFDRVCADGIRFDAAFTTNPKCAPSRASILTGRHTWQNRESCLHIDYWPDNLPVYTDMLDYAYEIEWFDAQLMKILARLEEIGEQDNTLVVVTSDNGCPFPRVKGQMYDDDFKLPFGVMWGDRIGSGRVVGILSVLLISSRPFSTLPGSRL